MDDLVGELQNIVAGDADRAIKATRITRALRAIGPYRWVGIYDVDLQSGMVSNIAWDGPNAPAYPTFKISEGSTSRAMSQKKTVNVGDVAGDAQYLTALESTRSEIIVPVVDDLSDSVVGTIDVESQRSNAFDSDAETLLEECATVLKPFWTARGQYR